MLATEGVANSSNYSLRLTRYTIPNVLLAKRATAALQLQAASVPASTELRLRYSLPAPGPVRLLLRDAIGRTVSITAFRAIAAGVHDATLPVATLPAGTYFLTLKAGSISQTQRVIISQ